MDPVLNDRTVTGCIILLKREINTIPKIDFLSKKFVIVVIGINWNCKHCFGSLESPKYIDWFCFILFNCGLLKFMFLGSLTWIFSGTWIENLGCINSEKLGRPVLDIFQTNEWITISLSPGKILFGIKITKSLFRISSLGSLKSNWRNGHCTCYTIVIYVRESFRDKFQMNAVLRITSPHLVVLGVLSCINYPCLVTFW